MAQQQSACHGGDMGSILGSEDPLEKERATQSSILAWKTHRQRSLEGYSPKGCKELDTTEQLSKQHLE